MGNLYFHIDVDAFFASVEQAVHPEYRGLPVIIGAMPNERGVVSACSYEARRYGIHSAMPISQAYARCPHAVFLPVHFELYRNVSRTIMDCFRRYSPIVRQLSIDEASLDMSGTGRIYPNPEETAAEIKKTVFGETGVTISVGIAANKYIAKLASEFRKPDGLFRVYPGEECEFVEKIPLKNLWGIGKATLEKLESHGIRTVIRLRETPLSLLEREFGNAMGNFLYSAARGNDPGIFKEEHKSRSISHEETFSEDTDDPEKIHICLSRLCERVFFRLLSCCGKGKTVFVKIRYSDFSSTTVRETFPQTIPHSTALLHCVETLFSRRYISGEKLRLLGVGICFDEEPVFQPELFPPSDHDEKHCRTEQAVLELKKKGLGLTKASSLSYDKFI